MYVRGINLMSPSQHPSGKDLILVDVFVNDKRWTRVDSFYGRDAKDQIYIVRPDNSGRTFVIFGDGRQGRRLPPGATVSAAYRRKDTREIVRVKMKRVSVDPPSDVARWVGL